MKILLLFLICLLLSGCWNGVVQPSDRGIEMHFKRFKTLRQQESYFEDGTWNSERDTFESPMHQSLLAIEAYFKAHPPSQSELKVSLGEPDAQTSPVCEGCWVYFWRGWHDYLYFQFDETKKAEVKWYQALD